jgi:hypothetical protein
MPAKLDTSKLLQINNKNFEAVKYRTALKLRKAFVKSIDMFLLTMALQSEEHVWTGQMLATFAGSMNDEAKAKFTKGLTSGLIKKKFYKNSYDFDNAKMGERRSVNTGFRRKLVTNESKFDGTARSTDLHNLRLSATVEYVYRSHYLFAKAFEAKAIAAFKKEFASESKTTIKFTIG